jgi:diguanylate cyclase (GGDEF)-like protein/PAS domain S-box-containing protein
MADDSWARTGEVSIDALLDDRHLLDTLLEYSPDHIYFKDRKSRFIRVSRSLAEWMGLSDPIDAIGRSDDDFFAAAHAWKSRTDEAEIMRSGTALVGAEECEVWPDGRESWVSTTKAPLRDHAGALIGIFGMSRDITARKLAEHVLATQAAELAEQAQMLRDLAARDELTGLPNRRGFFDAATYSLEMAKQGSLQATMFFIDLDGLKAINDQYGHAIGDRALTAVANALRTLTDTQRIAGRVGGDEFCILQTAPPDDPTLTETVVETAIAAAAVGANLPQLRASIGKVNATSISDLDQLIAMSDFEMYARKRDRSASKS